jgi:SNF2 family DNA or RNA helicase
MVEAQAVDRVHRKGQTRLVTVTRYLVPNSIEGVSGLRKCRLSEMLFLTIV